MAPGSRASCPPRTMNEEARAMGVQPVVPIRVRARPQCIFSQSPPLRAACIFSLGRPTFATLRPNLAYFRILPPYAPRTQTHTGRLSRRSHGGDSVRTRSDKTQHIISHRKTNTLDTNRRNSGLRRCRRCALPLAAHANVQLLVWRICSHHLQDDADQEEPHRGAP